MKHEQNVTKFKQWEMVQKKNIVMAPSPTKQRVNPGGDDDDDDDKDEYIHLSTS